MQDRTLALLPDEQVLLERAAAWADTRTLAELSHELLQHIARDKGIDFATAVVYDRLRRSETHGPGICEWEVRLHSSLPRPPQTVRSRWYRAHSIKTGIGTPALTGKSWWRRPLDWDSRPL